MYKRIFENPTNKTTPNGHLEHIVIAFFFICLTIIRVCKVWTKNINAILLNICQHYVSPFLINSGIQELFEYPQQWVNNLIVIQIMWQFFCLGRNHLTSRGYCYLSLSELFPRKERNSFKVFEAWPQFFFYQIGFQNILFRTKTYRLWFLK